MRYTLMVCCIASLSAPSAAPICGNAGKMVSIENGPNIASPPSSRARRRSGIAVRTGGIGPLSWACPDRAMVMDHASGRPGGRMLQRVIEQRRKDLGGGFEVGRVLPVRGQRMVGPFIFFDHIGPTTFPPGIPRSIDVRPHPHIGLSTVTYLFAGEMMHRDSVGSEQPIRPGEVNWMTAGRGITHSERFEQARREGGAMDGIQAWVALPEEKEEADPAFSHHTAKVLDKHLRLIAGEAFGEKSPVPVH